MNAGNKLTFHSADSIMREEGVDGEFKYPEYLNSINLNGMPLAKLKLKICADIW